MSNFVILFFKNIISSRKKEYHLFEKNFSPPLFWPFRMLPHVFIIVIIWTALKKTAKTYRKSAAVRIGKAVAVDVVIQIAFANLRLIWKSSHPDSARVLMTGVFVRALSARQLISVKRPMKMPLLLITAAKGAHHFFMVSSNLCACVCLSITVSPSALVNDFPAIFCTFFGSTARHTNCLLPFLYRWWQSVVVGNSRDVNLQI